MSDRLSISCIALLVAMIAQTAFARSGATQLSSDDFNRRLDTRMANATESLQQPVGNDADGMGRKIFPVHGVADTDPRLSRPRIRYAQETATLPVRMHRLVSLGATRAYQSIRDELEAMEKGGFQSRRFLALMKDDLPVLLASFGLPADPQSLLETLRLLCRGPGSNRMVLWTAADAVSAAYEPLMAAAAGPPVPDSPPDADTILSQGRGATGVLEAMLRDTQQRDTLLHLFQAEVIPSVVAQQPPDDPLPLRRAIRDAYYVLGYPPAYRAAYQRALASLGSEELAQDQASREKLAALARRFARADTTSAFGRAFDAYRQASTAGRVPTRDSEGSFVAAFSAAAARILAAESTQRAAAWQRAEVARETQRLASSEIEKAEAAVVDANRLIRVANQAILREQERHQAALAARNEVVSELNAAVDRANAARRTGGAQLHEARAEARRVEQALHERLASTEQAYRQANEALEAAEQAALDELNRARQQRARARAETAREAESLEAERAAETSAHRSRSRFAEVLGRLIAGLSFVGIHGDPETIGEPDQDESVRLASVALLLESQKAIPAQLAKALARERGGDSALAKLATLAAERPRGETP